MNHSIQKWLIPFLPAVILLVTYATVPNRYKMHDAIVYAMAIERGDIWSPLLWHPSHLLYGPLGYVLFHGARTFGLDVTVFQVYSAIGILGAFALVSALGFLLISRGHPPQSVAPVLLMWVGSYAGWHSSTSSDLARNILPLLLVVLAFSVILHGTTRSTRGWPVLAGFTLGLAGLAHILVIWTVPSVFFLIWKTDAGYRLRSSLTVFATAALLAVIGYLAPALFVHGVKDPQEFSVWFLRPGGAEWLQPDLLRGLLDLFLTALRGVFGVVTQPALKASVLSGGAERPTVLFLALFGVLIVGACCASVLSSIARPSEGRSPFRTAMLTWLGLHGAFAVFYDPGNMRMVLYLSIPLLALTADSALDNRRLLAATLTAAVLFAMNAPIMLQESRPHTQKAAQVLAAMNALSRDPGDLFLVPMGTDAAYAEYFGGRKAIPVWADSPPRGKLARAIWDAQEHGHRVFIEAEVVERIGLRGAGSEPCFTRPQLGRAWHGVAAPQFWLLGPSKCLDLR